MYIPETYGSSAYAPVFEPHIEEHREERSVTKHKTRNLAPKAKKVMVIGVLWICAIVLLVRYAMIAEECNQVEKLSARYDEVHAEVVQQELARNKEVNLAYVEEYAVNELGMVRPSHEQEIYITVQQEDFGEVLTAPQEEGFFAAAGNRILSVLEYLY